uniref:Uncharacterized protein n=1 Tax=Rhizophora mucronata TaxID=61149 RepID=A0A2P2NH48_RHIMU
MWPSLHKEQMASNYSYNQYNNYKKISLQHHLSFSVTTTT